MATLRASHFALALRTASNDKGSPFCCARDIGPRASYVISRNHTPNKQNYLVCSQFEGELAPLGHATFPEERLIYSLQSDERKSNKEKYAIDDPIGQSAFAGASSGSPVGILVYEAGSWNAV
ncbi:hypothetical protein CAPTEDRAFT_206667 [Capitella teleta]|uniref:Uncharacterized protein n=1 Tax=Capitella teleta TaxID=283909 RepID=R7UDK6_CAPTE|nr:hypothetical protein CAPTEDRAFT_206667 [Capitella teleta]|eukprot:ELU04064.1 hypothetical protein CAPTEDRAFT_206667 [Capitella teleta]